MAVSRRNRCKHCAEVIGVYEPAVEVVDGQARETSCAATPALAGSSAELYHRACYLERLRNVPADGSLGGVAADGSLGGVAADGSRGGVAADGSLGGVALDGVSGDASVGDQDRERRLRAAG